MKNLKFTKNKFKFVLTIITLIFIFTIIAISYFGKTKKIKVISDRYKEHSGNEVFKNYSDLANNGKIFNVVPFRCPDEKKMEECMNEQHKAMNRAVKAIKNNPIFKDIKDKKASIEVIFIPKELPVNFKIQNSLISYNNSVMGIHIRSNKNKKLSITLNEMQRPLDIYDVDKMIFTVIERTLIIAIPFVD